MTVRGSDVAQARLRALGANAVPAVDAGLFEWGLSAMLDSQSHYVPVDTGILKGSGHVATPARRLGQLGSEAMSIVGRTDPGAVTVVLGYGGAACAYALSVHENPRAGKTGGLGPPNIRSGIKSRRLLSTRIRYKHWAATGQWKYLETPFKKWAPKSSLFIARAIRRMEVAVARGAKYVPAR